jgi:hypothetical protein
MSLILSGRCVLDVAMQHRVLKTAQSGSGLPSRGNQPGLYRRAPHSGTVCSTYDALRSTRLSPMRTVMR